MHACEEFTLPFHAGFGVCACACACGCGLLFPRKGFIDGRSARLPTIVPRPGAPNKAATGAFSSIIREPLHGRSFTCPIAMNRPHPVSGFVRVGAGIVRRVSCCFCRDRLPRRSIFAAPALFPGFMFLCCFVCFKCAMVSKVSYTC